MKKKLIIGVIIALIGILATWWLLIAGGYKKILPPIPAIVSSGTEDTSTLGDYKITVWAEVRNDGGDGDVVVAFTYRDKQSYTKTVSRFFKANETARMQIEFPEAKLFKDGFYKAEVR